MFGSLKRPSDGDEPAAKRTNKGEAKWDGQGGLIPTVAVTGAQSNDRLVGIAADSDKVVLRVVGTVLACGQTCATISPEEINAAYRAVYADPEPPLAARQVTIGKTGPMGSTCPDQFGDHSIRGQCNCPATARFVLEDAGCWIQSVPEDDKERFTNYILNQTPLTWRKLLQCFGNRQFMLRPSLFQVSVGVTEIEATDQTMNCVFDPDAPTVAYNLGDGMNILVNRGNSNPPLNTTASIESLVLEACPNLRSDDIRIIRAHTAAYTPGILKSAIQKMVRFRSHQVALHRTDHVVPTETYVAVLVATLAVHPGGFVPNLQQTVTGIVSTLKRVAIMLVEDSWAGKPRYLPALFGTAVACQRVAGFHPSRATIVGCIQLARDAHSSNTMIGYSKIHRHSSIRTQSTPKSTAHFTNAAKILRVLRSFEGDMAMLDRVVDLCHSPKGMPMVIAQTVPTVCVPECHIMDQHVRPSIGHVLGCSELTTFKQRFETIFTKVTGINERSHNVDGFEDRPIVRLVRWAQSILMDICHPVTPTNLPILDTLETRYYPDPGCLAAGVGPSTVTGLNNKRLTVCLPTTLTNNLENVMIPPARGKGEDWNDNVTPEAAQLADALRAHSRKIIQKKLMRVHSPVLPSGTASYRNNTWCFNRVPWKEYVEGGIPVSTPVHPDPEWIIDDNLLNNNKAIESALHTTGMGVCINSEVLLRALCEHVRRDIIVRVYGCIRQQYHVIDMPTPARDGSKGTDTMVAYDGDWDVWRFLVLVSRLYPGALSPGAPPKFTVPVATLLVKLIGDLNTIIQTPDNNNLWWTKPTWVQAERTLADIAKPHQRAAIARMNDHQELGVQGTYLVMPTGSGKTYTTTAHLIHCLFNTSMGSQTEYIVWVTPQGARVKLPDGSHTYQLVQTLMREFQAEGLVQLPIHYVPYKNPDLRKYHINVISDDHLRIIIANLMDIARHTIFVFDEGDRFYNATYRSSAALQLAAAGRYFIIQTATPMPNPNNLDRYVKWLGLTVNYPVNHKNYMVAACEMIAVAIPPTIVSEHHFHVVPRTATAIYAQQVYRTNRRWRDLFVAVQSELDPILGERAEHYARTDRTENPQGGCLVVCNNLEHVEAFLTMFRTRFPTTPCGTLANMTDPAIHVIAVPSTHCRGYNTGVRLGAQVSQPYPGNPASRKQMQGRIRRLTQYRKTIHYEIVYMEGTVTELLYERQQHGDGINESLEQIALEYDETVLQF